MVCAVRVASYWVLTICQNKPVRMAFEYKGFSKLSNPNEQDGARLPLQFNFALLFSADERLELEN